MECPFCQASLPPAAGLCSQCQQPVHPQASSFGRQESRLVKLKADLASGQISQAELNSAVEQLQWSSRSGQTWWLSFKGTWHRWQTDHWQVAAPELPAPNARRKTGRIAIAIAGFGLLLLAAAAATFLLAGWDEYKSSPMLVEQVPAAASVLAPMAPSTDQALILTKYGNPQAFSLLFYDQADGDQGQQTIRSETWTYYDHDVEYLFINGQLTDEIEIESETQNLTPLGVTPGQFQAYMSLDQVLSAAHAERYLVVPLEDGYLPNSSVYYCQGLSFGLQNGELRYLEALAVELEETS